MKSEIIVNPSGDTLTILEGKAMPIQEPVKPYYEGNIDTVSRWLNTRENNGGVAVIATMDNLDEGIAATIEYHDEITEYYGAKVRGVLRLHPDFDALDLGNQVEMTKKDFVRFIKKYRYLFPDKNEFSNLLVKVEKFSAKVQQDIVDKTNDRGNKANGFAQIVTDHDIPTSIRVKVPIFKGEKPIDFRLELPFDVRTGAIFFWLESPDAVEALQYHRSEILERERTAILNKISTILDK